jgi:uncharacterized protein
MKRMSRWLLVLLLCLGPAGGLFAEKVKDLPAPVAGGDRSYVSDFAHALSPTTIQNVDDLCLQLERRANAQVVVVMIKTLDDDQSIDEFTNELEQKWGVGKKGSDRSVVVVIATESHKDRIEVGYGLEGILNDAKVGDIRRVMTPSAHTGDFDTAVTLGVQQIAQVIAADAGISLTPTQPVHQYHYQQSQPVQLSLWQVLLGGAVLIGIVIFLIATGNIGILWMLLSMFMGGGRGGGGRDDRGGGGGFGGFGGGSSGGGGASGDF